MKVFVHADGGDCHGTPLESGRCPKCGICPDSQSVELWSTTVIPTPQSFPSYTPEHDSIYQRFTQLEGMLTGVTDLGWQGVS